VPARCFGNFDLKFVECAQCCFYLSCESKTKLLQIWSETPTVQPLELGFEDIIPFAPEIYDES